MASTNVRSRSVVVQLYSLYTIVSGQAVSLDPTEFHKETPLSTGPSVNSMAAAEGAVITQEGANGEQDASTGSRVNMSGDTEAWVLTMILASV